MGGRPREEGDDPRLRRAMEIVYQVEGVTAARIWRWSGGISVGLRVSGTSSPEEVIGRVRSATAPLQEGETWDFGLLDD